MLVADSGREARTVGWWRIATGLILLGLGIASLLTQLPKADSPADMTPVISLLFLFIGLTSIVPGVLAVGRVNCLTLSVGDRTYLWKHGSYTRVETQSGTFDDFSGLTLSGERLKNPFPSRRGPSTSPVWRLYLNWKDGDSLPLSFFELTAQEVSDERAEEFAALVADHLGLPLLNEAPPLSLGERYARYIEETKRRSKEPN